MAITERYTKKAAILHWLVGILIIAAYFIGEEMLELSETYPDFESAPPEAQEWGQLMFFLHESFGITVLLLVFWRIVWRWKTKPPAMPGSLAKWNQKIATVIHYVLYALMVIMPLSGLLSGLIGGFGAIFWGIQIPPIMANEELSGAIFEVHEIGATIIFNVVILHLLGAAYHLVLSLFSDHDNVLLRMWPFGKGSA